MSPINPISSSSYPIPTLLEREGVAIVAFAYCPICNRVEKSDDEGCGQRQALESAIAKIQAHLRVAHRLF